MAFPSAFLDELTARNPIDEVVGQYVALNRSGSNLFGLCPFHGEKTASFSVAPDKGIYYCFGCHKGGGVINFTMEIENLSYPDAVRFLAKRVNMEVPEDDEYRSQYKQKERLWLLCKATARFFHNQLKQPIAAEAREYLFKRGLSAETITRFGIGFAPNAWSALTDAMVSQGFTKEELMEAGLVLQNKERGTIYDRFRNRVMFPIIDVRGNVIGFGGRVMDDSKPKYLNSPETVIFNKRRNLFAMNIVKKSKLDYIILTEGYMDAVALHQYGFDCAVASLGTSLTQEHADMLAKYTNQVILTYDGDEAGQNATKRAIPMLEKVGLKVKVLRMRDAKDPDEYLKKYGADRFRMLLEGSENQAEYRLQSIRAKYDLSLDEQKVSFAKEAADLIASFTSAVERELYAMRAAETAGISTEAMKQEINRAFKRRISREKRAETKKSLEIETQYQPKTREIRYDNMKMAIAEEKIIAMLFSEPALFEQTKDITPEYFSVDMFGRVFGILKTRWQEGLQISVSALTEDLTTAEMQHLTGVLTGQTPKVSENALQDCVNILKNEHQKTAAGSDLLAIQEAMKKKKSYGV